MAITLQTLKGFKELKTEEEQLKALFLLFGICIARLTDIENFFILFIKQNKYVFEGSAIGKTFTESQIKKIEDHYANCATLGMLINDFSEAYEADLIKDKLAELKRIRNLIIHPYFKFNWHQLPDQQNREEMYDDLLYVMNFLDDFDNEIATKEYVTIKNKDFVMMRKQKK
jgi:hypothetical protein